MEGLTASQAREHIEMVDHILTRSERTLRVGGEFFLVWGLWGAAVPLLFQLKAGGLVPDSALIILPVLIRGAIVFSVVRGRQLGRERDGLSLLQREFFSVLSISLGVTFVAAVLGYQLFPAFANSALWNVAGAIVLFFIASHGNGRALACGTIMIASIAAANFLPAYSGYALAAGMLFGYAGFGFLSLIARD